MRTTLQTLAAEGHRGGIDVRVSLRSDAGSGEQAFDGAWFPRSRDLAVELPELVAALDRRGLHIERFTYPLDAWSPAPRKVVVGGRVPGDTAGERRHLVAAVERRRRHVPAEEVGAAEDE